MKNAVYITETLVRRVIVDAPDALSFADVEDAAETWYRNGGVILDASDYVTSSVDLDPDDEIKEGEAADLVLDEHGKQKKGN